MTALGALMALTLPEETAGAEQTARGLFPPAAQPLRLRVNPAGVKLAFYHRNRALLPVKVKLNKAQFAQLEALVAGAGSEEWAEYYLGFDEGTLALHGIAAAPLESEGAR